jgi:hypothetical protein
MALYIHLNEIAFCENLSHVSNRHLQGFELAVGP